MSEVFDIVYELPRRKAIIAGSFADCPVDKSVIVRDGSGVLYDAIVDTRVTGGVVVTVLGVLAD